MVRSTKLFPYPCLPFLFRHSPFPHSFASFPSPLLPLPFPPPPPPPYLLFPQLFPNFLCRSSLFSPLPSLFFSTSVPHLPYLSPPILSFPTPLPMLPSPSPPPSFQPPPPPTPPPASPPRPHRCSPVNPFTLEEKVKTVTSDTCKRLYRAAFVSFLSVLRHLSARDSFDFFLFFFDGLFRLC